MLKLHISTVSTSLVYIVIATAQVSGYVMEWKISSDYYIIYMYALYI